LRKPAARSFLGLFDQPLSDGSFAHEPSEDRPVPPIDSMPAPVKQSETEAPRHRDI
jgi:hypothetical protein